MNFLAHSFLSFSIPDIIVGNLIADTIRGKQIEVFPEGIREGIRIHRLIDEFTDKHPINKEVKLVFREKAGRYDSSFLDVAYDHFVALDSENTPTEGWESFAQHCYEQIEQRGDILPADFASMYMYMRNENWLANYHNKWMIERSFERLTRRANYLDNDTNVFSAFEENYTEIGEAYAIFFPQLKEYTYDLIFGK